ncbi:MAG: hypothetical protein J6R94_04715, partial [Agathobacter sp.]|nr:hypothetical protein [Agathobacter sp.]
MWKKLIVICLILSTMIGGVAQVPWSVQAAETKYEDELQAVIAPQINAYAASINQSNAASSAWKTLALQGVTGRGKTLSVGESHALTATIMNSQLRKESLTDYCALAIQQMNMLGLDSIYGTGFINWGEGIRSTYISLREAESRPEEEVIIQSKEQANSTTGNSYDQALEWMTGSTSTQLYIKKIKTTATTFTYSVKLVHGDRFDFRGDNGS